MTEVAKLYCSFCGKSDKEVAMLIAGPTVFICDECVELCMEIVNQNRAIDVERIWHDQQTYELTLRLQRD